MIQNQNQWHKPAVIKAMQLLSDFVWLRIFIVPFSLPVATGAVVAAQLTAAG